MNNAAFIYKRLPLSSEYLLRILAGKRLGFLLESSLHAYHLGRFSFFGIDPFMILESKDGRTSLIEDGVRTTSDTCVFQQMRTFLNRYRLNTKHTKIDIPFLGGAMGFLSYDLGFSLEKISRTNRDDLAIPDVWLAFFDAVIGIDHDKDRVLVFSSGFPETNPRLRRIRSEMRLKQLLAELRSRETDDGWHYRRALFCKPYQLQSNFTPQEYMDAVKRSLAYIKSGDIYQINLSQRFQTKTDFTSEKLYMNLRNVFPVPFGGILCSDDFSIISGSPERFLKYDGRFVVTRPMKGTRARAADKRRDQKLRQELQKSTKDKAELLMIVDLERNDLGRVCDYGSVHVEELRCLEEYSSVFQTTAQIVGRLYQGMDRIDIIKACFPGGSISGCPKIRAMQIIEELEPNRRGIYTGSMGYFSFNGQMDLNILIRSFFKRRRDVYFGVGGGIVYDSQPSAEYEETLVKAEALKRALLPIDIGNYKRNMQTEQIVTSAKKIGTLLKGVSLFSFSLMVTSAVWLVVLCGCQAQQESLDKKTQQADFYAAQGQEHIQKAVVLYQELIQRVNDDAKKDSLRLRLGNLYFAIGRYADAIDCFQALSAKEAQTKLAIAYVKDARYADALALFEQQGHFPDAEYLYYYAQAAEKVNLYDKAVSLYRAIDKDSPFFLMAQKRTTTINLSEEVLSTQQVKTILESAPGQKEYPHAGALILRVDETFEVFDDNTSAYDMHYMVKIFNQRGKDRFSEIQIEYDSTFEQVELEFARTIKPDGTVVSVGDKNIRDVSIYLNYPLYSNARARIISMPEVAEGVIIEYRAKRIRKQMVNKKDFIVTYAVQESEPIREANFSVIIPQQRDLRYTVINAQYNTFGAQLEPQESLRGDKKVFHWHLENIPEVLPEPDMSPFSRTNPFIMISSFRDWEEVYRWLSDLYRDKTSIDENIRKKIDVLTTDKSSASEKARAIYNFCAQHIRYVAVEYGEAGYEPHRAIDIFQNKYGDCKDQAILLIAMLQSVGIQAYPVLIGTYDYIDLPRAFPTLAFDHCIAAARIEDEWVFMDPTGETVSFGDLPAMDQNRFVFVFLDDTYTILPTPLFPASHNVSQVNTRIKINADETIAVKQSISTAGVFMQGQRDWLRSIKPSLIEEILRGTANAFAAGAQLKHYTIDNQDDLDKAIILEYEFEAPEFLTKAGSFRMLPQLGDIDIWSVAKEQRLYPIEYSFLKEVVMVAEIEIPKQFFIHYLPENITFDTEWFTFENTYSATDKIISFYAKFTTKKNMVSQKDYKDYKALLETISRKVNQRIILQTKP